MSGNWLVWTLLFLALPLECISGQDLAAGMGGSACKHRIAWRLDYRAALEEARAARAMALVWFHDSSDTQKNEAIECSLLAPCLEEDGQLRCIPVRLATDAVLPSGGKSGSLRLLQHPAFAEMQGGSGIALIDMRNETSPYFHHVISVYPFVNGPILEHELKVMLELPTGSLTQRTLIWAVRTHPDHPASTSGKPSELLMEHAASHSRHQASIRVQGHHHWDERFEEINAQLPAGLVAKEICAESWPGQPLVMAARECVSSWRQSSGHWEAVRTAHPLFGYDMQRGANGIWYATGTFAKEQ